MSDYDEVFNLTASPKAHYYLGRGLTLDRLGDAARAKADLETGLRLVPQATVDPQVADLDAQARRVLGRLALRAAPGPVAGVIDLAGRSSGQRVKRLDPAPEATRRSA